MLYKGVQSFVVVVVVVVVVVFVFNTWSFSFLCCSDMPTWSLTCLPWWSMQVYQILLLSQIKLLKRSVIFFVFVFVSVSLVSYAVLINFIFDNEMHTRHNSKFRKRYVDIRAGMVGAVVRPLFSDHKFPSSIRAVPRFEQFLQPSFPPKLTQLSILPG